MNELLQKLQELWSNLGPDVWQKPGVWIVAGCAGVVALLLLRMLFKRGPQSSREVDSRANASGGVFGPLTGALAAQIPESEKEHKEFGQLLKQAGMYSPTARASVYAYRFLLLAFPLLCAGILAIAAPPPQAWKFLVGGGLVAMLLAIIPRLYVYFRRQNRLREISRGLADMLDMLSMCLGSGMPLSASLDHVSKNLVSYPALAQELQIMRRHSDVHSLRLALSEWANRLDTPEVRQVASLLARGDQLGVSLGGSLMDQADHFRTTRRQMATLEANRTPVLLTFPLLFCFAPAVLILLMSPAFMQLSDFFTGKNSSNPLENNSTLNTTRLINTIGSIDQQTGGVTGAPAPAAPNRPR